MTSSLLPVHLQVFAVVTLLAFLAWVVHLIRRHRLSLRDSLLWFLSTSAGLVMTVFPATTTWLAATLGIRVPANALFGLAFLYVLVNLLAVTIATSGQAMKIRRLAQECALMRAEMAALRSRIERDRAGVQR